MKAKRWQSWLRVAPLIAAVVGSGCAMDMCPVSETPSPDQNNGAEEDFVDCGEEVDALALAPGVGTQQPQAIWSDSAGEAEKERMDRVGFVRPPVVILVFRDDNAGGTNGGGTKIWRP